MNIIIIDIKKKEPLADVFPVNFIKDVDTQRRNSGIMPLANHLKINGKA